MRRGRGRDDLASDNRKGRGGGSTEAMIKRQITVVTRTWRGGDTEYNRSPWLLDYPIVMMDSD